jgi:hypothetical protein
MSLSASIAAVSALLALIFSIYVYFRTRRLSKPKERPIIIIIPKISDPKFSVNRERKTSTIRMTIEFQFKNVGIHPAKNMHFIIGSAVKRDLGTFKVLEDRKICNLIENLGIYYFWQEVGKKVQVDEKSIDEIVDAKGLKILDNEQVYYYVLVKYEDFYFPKREYSGEFYYSFILGKHAIISLTTSEKESIEPYVRKIIKKNGAR